LPRQKQDKNMTDIQNELLSFLIATYKKMMLTPREASVEVGRSIQSLQRDRKDGAGIAYKKAEGADNSKIYYPISAAVEYLSQNLVVTK